MVSSKANERPGSVHADMRGSRRVMTLGGWMGPLLGSRLRSTCRNQGDPRFSNGNRRRSKGGGVSHLHHAGFSLP